MFKDLEKLADAYRKLRTQKINKGEIINEREMLRLYDEGVCSIIAKWRGRFSSDYERRLRNLVKFLNVSGPEVPKQAILDIIGDLDD